MPTTVKFWLLPREEEDLLSFLESAGRVIAVPFEQCRRREELRARPLREFVEGHDPDQVLVGVNSLADAVRIHTFEDDAGTYFVASPIDSPLIAYRRGKLGGNRLVGSSLTAYWSFVNDDKSGLVDKPSEFTDWAKQVFRWVRRWCPERDHGGQRMTSDVARAVETGLELVP